MKSTRGITLAQLFAAKSRGVYYEKDALSTMKSAAFVILSFSCLLVACASTEVERTGLKAEPPPPPRVAPLVQEAAAPGSAATAGAPASAVNQPSAAPSSDFAGKDKAAAKASPKVKAADWRLKTAQVIGPGQVSPKGIGDFKDPKTGAITHTRCWNYRTFAITESRTKGEIGAGEVNIRRAEGKAKQNLCAKDFDGKIDSLDIIEGYYAGLAGDYLVIEGADVGEGLPQFQIFSAVTGKQVLKETHDPSEDFVISLRGHRASLLFYAKVPVKCELLEEGQECWKKVLAQLPSVKPMPMPDCAASFKAAKASLQDTPQVAMRAEVSDLANAKVTVVGGGKATCRPGPQ